MATGSRYAPYTRPSRVASSSDATDNTASASGLVVASTASASTPVLFQYTYFFHGLGVLAGNIPPRDLPRDGLFTPIPDGREVRQHPGAFSYTRLGWAKPDHPEHALTVLRPRYRGPLLRALGVLHIVRGPNGWAMDRNQAAEWVAILQVSGSIIRVLARAAKGVRFQGLPSVDNFGMNWPDPTHWLSFYPTEELAESAAAASRAKFRNVFSTMTLWMFGPFRRDPWADDKGWGKPLTDAGVPASIISEIARSFIASSNEVRVGAIIDARLGRCPWPEWVPALERACTPCLFFYGPSLSSPAEIDPRWKYRTPTEHQVQGHIPVRLEIDGWRVQSRPQRASMTDASQEDTTENGALDVQHDGDNLRSSYAPFESGQRPGEHPLDWLQRMEEDRVRKMETEDPASARRRVAAETVWMSSIPYLLTANVSLWNWRQVQAVDGAAEYYVRERLPSNVVPGLSQEQWPASSRFVNFFTSSIDNCPLFVRNTVVDHVMDDARPPEHSAESLTHPDSLDALRPITHVHRIVDAPTVGSDIPSRTDSPQNPTAEASLRANITRAYEEDDQGTSAWWCPADWIVLKYAYGFHDPGNGFAASCLSNPVSLRIAEKVLAIGGGAHDSTPSVSTSALRAFVAALTVPHIPIRLVPFLDLNSAHDLLATGFLVKKHVVTEWVWQVSQLPHRYVKRGVTVYSLECPCPSQDRRRKWVLFLRRARDVMFSLRMVPLLPSDPDRVLSLATVLLDYGITFTTRVHRRSESTPPAPRFPEHVPRLEHETSMTWGMYVSELRDMWSPASSRAALLLGGLPHKLARRYSPYADVPLLLAAPDPIHPCNAFWSSNATGGFDVYWDYELGPGERERLSGRYRVVQADARKGPLLVGWWPRFDVYAKNSAEDGRISAHGEHDFAKKLTAFANGAAPLKVKALSHSTQSHQLNRVVRSNIERICEEYMAATGICDNGHV